MKVRTLMEVTILLKHATGAATSVENIQPEIDNSHQEDSQEDIEPKEAVRALGQHAESTSNAMKQNHHFVIIRHEMVSRLELEATHHNMILSIGHLLLFALPWIISSMLALICHWNVARQVKNGEEKQSEAVVEQCSSYYYWAITYTRLILLVAHSIYLSICYVIRSKDLRTALGRR